MALFCDICDVLYFEFGRKKVMKRREKKEGEIGHLTATAWGDQKSQLSERPLQNHSLHWFFRPCFYGLKMPSDHQKPLNLHTLNKSPQNPFESNHATLLPPAYEPPL